MIAVGQFLDFLLLGSIIDLALHISQDNVFCDCMCPDEGEMLLDHGDSQRHGISRRRYILFNSVNPDLSGCHVVDPVQDIHDRTLAGAVFAEQSNDFALAQLDGDIVVGQHFREPFADAVDLYHRRLCFLFLFHKGPP